ncbi:MAG: aldehyde dehydrogenase family protein, partial [Candidatus Aminicenantales bacterium]
MDGRLIIRNERIETADKLVSENPATLEPVGEASLASGALCDRAVQAAKEAFPLWRALSPGKRGEIFKKAEKILA